MLLHTKTGIEATLAFIKETGVATRKWHLRRGEGEEDDEDDPFAA